MDFPAYQAVLYLEGSGEGEPVWSGSGLHPDATGGFALSFPPSTLEPGTYRLHLQGRSAAGQEVPAAELRFEVAPGS